MKPDDPRRNPYHNPRNRPSAWLLVMIAVGVAIVTTAFAWFMLYLRDIFSARPLG